MFFMCVVWGVSYWMNVDFFYVFNIIIKVVVF